MRFVTFAVGRAANDTPAAPSGSGLCPAKSPHDQASAVGGLDATVTYTAKALPPDRQNRWFASDTPLCDAISISETHPRVKTFMPTVMNWRILALASPSLDRGRVYCFGQSSIRMVQRVGGRRATSEAETFALPWIDNIINGQAARRTS